MTPITLPGGEHAVLLLHGLQSSPAELLPLAKRLQQAGYTVHLPHIAGYGFEHGDTPRSVTHWQDWHAKALEEFRALKRQYKSVAVGGLCIGGTLSLSIAAELGDQVAALTLLSTTLWYDGWAMPWYRIFRYLGYIWPFRYRYTYKEREPFGLKNQQLRRWIAREMAHKDASMIGASRLNMPAVQEAERLIAAAKKTMPRVTAPAIIIHAVEDEISSPRSALYTAKHIGSKTVETVMLHNCYHMITVDNDREQVADETIRFFAGARAQSTAS
ncbi:alpha/beta hydrolase [Sideroxydans lithotrophicus]|uniref:Alpha/beta hydrolase fold protein n=1 Tax=Sideroxydans lithotrophicus (strain ES-1) TaxID=580332 RepID=D5CM76_SIDLE|nr:alpha/beta fold hydrolase [Sideroxydans lithotrophicus]ADE10690.1 alpha/beta hydrolase fold protein [Sideroxydans lithotrophicus ES-1]